MDMNYAFIHEMTVTGTQFKWRLSDFVLEGTKFTSTNKLNFLKFGEPVNRGNVENAQDSAFIGLNTVESFTFDSKKQVIKFKETVSGNVSTLLSGKGDIQECKTKC